MNIEQQTMILCHHCLEIKGMGGFMLSKGGIRITICSRCMIEVAWAQPCERRN